MGHRIDSRVISFAVALLIATTSSVARSQDVELRLSSREAYVGSPIVLQIAIENASDYELPELPAIDGCRIESAGAPSQSSQVTIINGRRRESRSITFQYLVTPMREGRFTLPSLTIEVDGRTIRTEPQPFVASKSDTGDLLFVEVEGNANQVYVGEPLEMTLRIYLRPFQDREAGVKLSEGQMWQLVSDATSWGGFADRMEELAQNGQRPGGREILRDNGEGIERSYYLYEIDATVYPTRPGRLDASDVQVVVNWPTKLSKTRDPFEEMLEGSPFGRDPFGGSSLMRQFMDDDFFASPFRDRLSISDYRPIVAEASVGATEVLPIPTVGQPADYRGAVGRYQIVTQASPTEVSAGEPITLQIGIAGDGPMDLVQSPPLPEIEELTNSFRVPQQSLAGFVQGDAKVFVATIRPTRAGITQIPPIPFSFFDPTAERFETVYSDPIPITVNEAEMLVLDGIGNQKTQSTGADSKTDESNSLAPQMNIHTSLNVLDSQPQPTNRSLVFSLAFPPIIFLATLLYRHRAWALAPLFGLRGTKQTCRRMIQKAEGPAELADALAWYVGRRFKIRVESPRAAVGVLRTNRCDDVARALETFLDDLDRKMAPHASPETFAQWRERALSLLADLERHTSGKSWSQVRRRRQRSMGGMDSARADRRVVGNRRGQTVGLVLLALCVPLAMSADASDPDLNAAGISRKDDIQLNRLQQEQILAEATALYEEGMRLKNGETPDAAGAQVAFESAARKYQLLVDSGIRNGWLYLNLGNAYLQSGEPGRALANYRRAEQWLPDNAQLSRNLAYVESQFASQLERDESVGRTFQFRWQAIQETVIDWNRQAVRWLGVSRLTAITSFVSILFWGVLSLRAAGFRFRAGLIACCPLLLLVVGVASLLTYHLSISSDDLAIVVVDNLVLRAGDGERFESRGELKNAQGIPVRIQDSRGDWIQVETPRGDAGWIERRALEIVSEPR